MAPHRAAAQAARAGATAPALSPDDIHNRFSFHPAMSETRKNQHNYVRDVLERAAMNLAGNLPPGRELSLVITKLEEAMFWANAGLGRAVDEEAEELMSLTPLERAQRAYAAYGAVTGRKNFLGDPMPEWDELGDTIQSAWIAAANIGGTP
jgi:hypothetical protein